MLPLGEAAPTQYTVESRPFATCYWSRPQHAEPTASRVAREIPSPPFPKPNGRRPPPPPSPPQPKETVPRTGPRRAARTDPSNASDQGRVRPRGSGSAPAHCRSVPPSGSLLSPQRPLCSALFFLPFQVQIFVLLLFLLGPSAEVVTGGASSRRWRASRAAKGKAPAKVRF
jgi:hypothetical protein